MDTTQVCCNYDLIKCILNLPNQSNFASYAPVLLVSSVGMALEFKCVVETILIKVSYHYISHSFHLNSYLTIRNSSYLATAK